MNSVEKLIEKNNLILANDIVGVAVSGGTDSMSLLHFLNEKKQQLGCEIVAITIDHGIRATSKQDVDFVVNYCNKNNIKVLKFNGSVGELSETNKQTLEQAAREFRYKIFGDLLAKKVVTKIALGHHLQDQAETILLNIFRGTGLMGASGMDVVRDKVYLRPLLKTPKAEIMAYINQNEIPYVEDETNQSNEYARNYIRNLIMPLVRNKWKNADHAISNFGEVCKKDEAYIQGTISMDGIVTEEGTVKIPVTYFVYEEPVVKRMLLNAMKSIGVTSDWENKHLDLACDLALNGENGTGITLPNKVKAIKEYNYLTITNNLFVPTPKTWKFAPGKIDVTGYGVVEVQKLRTPEFDSYDHIIDAKKLPKNVVWRYREDGDVFEKFGGGTKNLSDFLTDKKIPRRLRNLLPVLASDKEIYVVAGVEISNKLRTDEQTKSCYGIRAVRFE